MSLGPIEPKMSFPEIADELGIPVNSVVAAYNRGMKKLAAHGMPAAFPMIAELHCGREYAVPPARRKVEFVRLAVN